MANSLLIIHNISFALAAMAMLFLSSSISMAMSPSEILTTIGTDKSTYEYREDMNITIELFNPTNSTIDLVSASNPPWNIFIKNESGEIVVQFWKQTMMVHDTIDSNESMIFTIEVTKDLYPGFYLIEGWAFDASSEQLWIKINGTIAENAPQDNSVYVASIFIIGVGIGLAAMYIIHIARKKQ